MSIEQDNILEALDTVLQRREVALLPHFATHLWYHFTGQGQSSLAVEIYEELRTVAEQLDIPLLIFYSYLGLASGYVWLGKSQLGLDLALQASKLARKLDLPYELSMALWNIGYAHVMLAQLQDALCAGEELLALSERGGPTVRSRALRMLAWVNSDLGNSSLSEAYWEEAAEISRQMGNELQRSVALGSLGMSIMNRDPVRAREMFRECLKEFRAHNLRSSMPMALCCLAEVEARLGNTAEAAVVIAAARSAALELGDKHYLGFVLLAEGELALMQEDACTACARFQEALSLGLATGNFWGELNARERLLRLNYANGDLHSSTQHLVRQIEMAAQQKLQLAVVDCSAYAAALLARRGQFAPCALLLGAWPANFSRFESDADPGARRAIDEATVLLNAAVESGVNEALACGEILEAGSQLNALDTLEVLLLFRTLLV